MEPYLIAVLPLILGYGLDLLLGDPAWLPHPVVGFGRAIRFCERRLNRGGRAVRFVTGAISSIGLVAGVYLLALGVERAAFACHPAAGIVVTTLGVFVSLANRTLIAEGRAVFAALERGLDAGRRQVSRIVGRDTRALSAHEVRIATFETMAENLSDGVVAPLCYYAVGGVPAMLAYKIVNTLDSMIGHRDARFEWYGKAAARLDDAANYVPARLTALLLILFSASGRGWRFVRRYARRHASPNAGFPEAALAGVLDLRFGGPHAYDGDVVPGAWIGENERGIAAEEINIVARLNHLVCLASVLGAAGASWLRVGPFSP